MRFSKSSALLLMLVIMVGVVFAAQTVLTPQVAKENNYNVQAGDLALTETACDNVNGNAFALTGREVLIVHNTDAAGAHTFSVTSVADQLGRTQDITSYSVPLSAIAVLDMDTVAGWRQSNGQVYLACNSNLIKFGIVRLP